MKGKCVDIATGVSRPVAIKFLYDDLPPHAIERARREASIQLRNDNLIEMLGIIETETRSCKHMQKHYHVVSELLHGISYSYPDWISVTKNGNILTLTASANKNRKNVLLCKW